MIGQTLGHYRIVERVGAGGMGEVYRARDTRLDRDVAVKVLPEKLAGDPERLARFEREAKAVAKLTHPNILDIHDLGTDHGVTYAVTELLEGKTLRRCVHAKGLGWRKAVEIVAAVADGLAAAHAQGVIHRDLKPENIFLTADGQVKILDFGLAKLTYAKAMADPMSGAATLTALTGDGRVLGTPGYMSPEQVRAEPVDVRSDLFSLGCVLYELVSGQRAFSGKVAFETLTATTRQTPPELSSPHEELPSELVKLVARCLEKSPGERFQSARDLAFALRSLVTAGGTRTPARVATGRRRSLLWITIGVAVAAMIGASILWWTRPPPELARGPGEDRVVVAPFEDHTDDPGLASLGLAAADWITGGLSRTGSVAVVASVSVQPGLLALTGSDGGAGDYRALAAETGAGVVVSGSYSVHGETLYLQAVVMDATRDEIIRVLEPASGPLGDPRVALAELKQGVMGFFEVQDTELGSHEPPRFDAYREYLTGYQLFGIDFKGAIEHFQRAMELDPDFLSPQLPIASALINQGRHAEAEALVRVLDENRHRLSQYDRLLLDWHYAALEGRAHDALRIVRSAEQIAPKSLIVNYLIGFESLRVNRPREALATFQKIPSTQWHNHVFGGYRLGMLTSALHMLGNHSEELDEARKARGLYPDHLATLANEVRALAALGEPAAVRRLIDESLSIQPLELSAGDVMRQAVLETRAHGDPESAKEIAEQAIAWYRDRPPDEVAGTVHRHALARVLYLAGHWDEARRLLREISAEHPDDVAALGELGSAGVRCGDREAGERISAELERLDRRYLYGNHLYQSARIASLLGDRPRAVDLLREALAQGWRGVTSLHRNVDLEPLRDYPPFQELLRPKG